MLVAFRRESGALGKFSGTLVREGTYSTDIPALPGDFREGRPFERIGQRFIALHALLRYTFIVENHGVSPHE